MVINNVFYRSVWKFNVFNTSYFSFVCLKFRTFYLEVLKTAAFRPKQNYYITETQTMLLILSERLTSVCVFYI